MRLGKVFALPVLDDRTRLAGIVTDRDIFRLTNIEMKSAVHDLGLERDEDAWTWEGLRNVTRLLWVERKIELPGGPVRDVMIKDPVTVFRKTGVSEAARLMHRHDFGQLPIVDTGGELFAVLYELDVVIALV